VRLSELLETTIQLLKSQGSATLNCLVTFPAETSSASSLVAVPRQRFVPQNRKPLADWAENGCDINRMPLEPLQREAPETAETEGSTGQQPW
jgi:hypothetical protein